MSAAKRVRSEDEPEVKKYLMITVNYQADNSSWAVVVERNLLWFPEKFDLAFDAPKNELMFMPGEDAPDPVLTALAIQAFGVEVKKRSAHDGVDVDDRDIRHQFITDQVAITGCLDLPLRKAKHLPTTFPVNGLIRPYFVCYD